MRAEIIDALERIRTVATMGELIELLRRAKNMAEAEAIMCDWIHSIAERQRISIWEATIIACSNVRFAQTCAGGGLELFDQPETMADRPVMATVH